MSETEERLDRIEKVLRFMVKRLVYPSVPAFDGLPPKEREERWRQYDRGVDEMVERIMQNGSPYIEDQK